MMTTSIEISRIGNVVVAYDFPSEELFAEISTWRQYYAPDEFQLMRAHGATDEWIQENIIDRLEDGDVWYALIGAQPAPPTIYMAIATNFLIADQTLAGYLTLVDGEITSGRTFQSEILLSSSEELAEDNWNALEDLAQIVRRPRSELLPVRYQRMDDRAIAVLDVALPSDVSKA